ncbi:MAG TPA: hypothetical protein VGM06_14080 [Polyangiaceae bacterium]
MKRRVPFVIAALVVALVECQGESDHGPQPCLPIDPQVQGTSLPADTVWGFVDLHAHPAIERAFGGRLIWGSAIDGAPVDSAELPVITSCPVETHDPDAASPLERAVGTLVFPGVAQQGHFAHAPVGDVMPTDAWPNARDVIHQQMNVASIRRAYEAGLRLMFASTTDDQVIRTLLGGPNFINGFVPDPEADFESAKAQIELIERIVEQNSNWMGIARDPDSARRIIGDGRLAVVVSLEMNGLTEPDLDTLVDDYGVRHIVPIHLIDNDVGGTAANSDLFNAASATVSEIYRSDHEPMRYMDVSPTTTYSQPLGWPQEIVSGPSIPLYINLQNVPYDGYAQLCYEPLADCSGPSAATTTFLEFGQVNQRGLCSTVDDCKLQPRPGVARIRHMMDGAGKSHTPLIIDLSHMGDASVKDTLGVAPSPGTAAAPAGYPLIASHGDFAHLCDGTPTQPPCVDTAPGLTTERQLLGEYARQIVARGGVLGLGSPVGSYGARAVLTARGGPLLTLRPAPGSTTGCVATPDGGGAATPGCAAVAAVDLVTPDTQIQTLEVSTVGGMSSANANAHPFVRVVLGGPNADRSQERVIVQPLDCSTESCGGTVDLGVQDLPTSPTSECTALTCDATGTCGTAPYTVGLIESVSLETSYLACDLACQQASSSVGSDLRCSTRWNGDAAPRWTIDQASLVALSNGQPMTLAQAGPVSSAPLTQLGQTRGKFTLYQHADQPSAGSGVPATGHLLRVSVTSGAEQTLVGAGATQRGPNVCVALRRTVAGACLSATPIAAGATECPAADGWAPINQRGTWADGALLYTFVRYAGPETDICGVDVAVLDWDPSSAPWMVDEIKVESIEDPVGRWIQRYAGASRYIANDVMGTLGFGTDFNGLNGMTDISEFAAPSGTTTTASACPVGGAPVPDAGAPAPQPLAPMRYRHSDGSLGGEVLIDERGLATYGLLADLMGIIAAYPGCGADVHASLMLSAEATIRAWEAIVEPTAPARAPLPTAAFACAPAPWSGP